VTNGLGHYVQRLRLEGTGRKFLNGSGERGSCGGIVCFKIGYSSRAAGEVGVGVDKAGDYHAPAGIDEVGLAGEREVFQSAAGSDVVDDSVDNQDRAVLNDAEVPKLGPAAGTAGTAQREKLPGAADQSGLRHWMGITPDWRRPRPFLGYNTIARGGEIL
jgi:hypothetical protein